MEPTHWHSLLRTNPAVHVAVLQVQCVLLVTPRAGTASVTRATPAGRRPPSQACGSVCTVDRCAHWHASYSESVFSSQAFN
jgi:hypothetical protein